LPHFAIFSDGRIGRSQGREVRKGWQDFSIEP
jgi:hypothetical protein